MHSSDSILWLALVILVGLRVFVAIHDRVPLDEAATIAIVSLVGLLWISLRSSSRR